MTTTMQIPKTVRLLMPQWQGGNNPNYPLGAELLAFLASDSGQEVLRVDIEAVHRDDAPQDGVAHRRALLQQLEQATALIEQAQPDRIVIFGGDCLVEQAPLSYLNARHGGKLGVLWIDAHPDIKTPEEWSYAHTMVVGNLLDEGDAEFAARVPTKIEPSRFMYAGLREEGLTRREAQSIRRFGLQNVPPEQLAIDSAPILDWIAAEGIDHIAIHLDLDALDPASFRSVLFAEPDPEIDWLEKYPTGKMTFAQVARVMADVASRAEVVGLGICEHLPWDMVHLKKALASFPVLT